MRINDNQHIITFINSLVNSINDGSITVKWSRWMFSGGRDWGDWTDYELFKNGQKFGDLEINQRNGLTLTSNARCIFGDFENESIIKTVEETILNALSRDDPEFISKITINNEIYMPMDYGDIDRNDILTGRWKPLEGFCEGQDIEEDL